MLAPDLFQRRFDDLMNIGRARLPAIAPDWTDHNAHDPGITLMELLAWTAEAQLYALSRMRRDERAAYAALLGIAPAGTTGAEGILWSDRLDPTSPAATFAQNVFVPADTTINVVGDDTPTFRPIRPLLWAPGRVRRLETRSAGAATVDHTATNARGGPAFLPFGDIAGRRSVLALTFACRADAGLFGATRGDAKGALWAIGVRAAPTLAGGADDPTAAAAAPCAGGRSPLVATYVGGSDRVPLPIVADTTRGMLATGALFLDVAPIPRAAQDITIELHAPDGLARPPRILHIEPSVIPIRQGQPVDGELQTATGAPDWSFRLALPGLRFAAGEEPVVVQVAEPRGSRTWARRSSLADCGPDDRGFELEPSTGLVTFGNGVNGKVPPVGAQVLVSYAVSDGERGDVARNRRWHVARFAGTFGVNLDPITGGARADGLPEERREARRRIRDEHPLISATDVRDAARALPLLEVARSWVVMPDDKTPRTGVVKLVVLRARTGASEPTRAPETSRWLAAVRRALAPRMPLGTRLTVTAPRSVSFSIRATLEIDAGRDPATIEKNADAELRKRLALVSADANAPLRQPGVPLTRRDVAAWLRTVDGVRRVAELHLIDAAGKDAGDQIAVPRSGLPRWIAASSAIKANRP